MIGIDGALRAGKTCLANKLGVAISAPVISLDCFRISDEDAYVSNLNHEEIRGQLAHDNNILIVEGVCLLAAAEQSQMNIDKLIYVKRIDRYGIWADGNDLTIVGNARDRIADLTSKIRRLPGNEKYELGGSRREIIHYHFNSNPVEVSNYIFQWDESR